jgi:hypothetical protein
LGSTPKGECHNDKRKKYCFHEKVSLNEFKFKATHIVSSKYPPRYYLELNHTCEGNCDRQLQCPTEPDLRYQH